MIELYKTAIAEARAEYIVNKSTFIAHLAHVETEQEAKAFLESIKKKYYDARHNCYAYILRQDGGKMKSSDDGEPAGTAGRPILETIDKNELTDTIIVVTRYFGGILLGAGGLVRAYSTVASMAIKACEIAQMQLCDIISVEASYKDSDNIKNIMDKANIFIENISYDEKVTFKLNIPINDSEALVEAINFNGNIIVKKLKKVYAKTDNILK